MAATNLTLSSKRSAGNGNQAQEYIWNATDTVITGTPEIFRIDSKDNNGKIIKFLFESLSPDCDVFLSTVDDLTAPSDETIVSLEGVKLLYSPKILAYYSNPTADNYHYLTIVNNSATATGNWNLRIIYERY